MTDIALGLQVVEGKESLSLFAKALGAAAMSEWADLGLFDEGVEGWGEAFEQVMTRTIAAGRRVHFEVNGLDIAGALAGNSAEWVGRYTAWELQQVVARTDWFSITSFYLRGRLLDGDELEKLGIRPI